MQKKKLTTAEAIKKMEAFKTLNSVLVQESAKFMKNIQILFAEKSKKLEELKEKLEKGEGTEDDNAEYIFLGGYTQALKDISKGRNE